MDFGISEIGLALSLASAAAGAATSLYAGHEAAAQGAAQQEAADFQSKQLDVNAGQEEAAAQRKAIESRRQGRLAASAVRARGAADGGSAMDPTILDLETKAVGEGEYQAMTDLYEGASRARDIRMQSSATKFEGAQYRAAGRRSQKASYISAPATLFSTAGQGLMAKYG
jgi:hypothetical protein